MSVLRLEIGMRKHVGLRILGFYLMSYSGRIVSGVERRFLEISSRLKAMKAEVFTLEYKPSLSESWGSSSYRSIKLDRRFRNHDVLETIRLILHGLRASIKFKCDVIYTPGGFPYGGFKILPPCVVGILCRKPLVIVIHALKSSGRRESQGFIARNVRLLTLKHAKACITVSNATANDIVKRFKIRRLVVTGNGVNLSLFRDADGQAKIYDAVYFGRISEEKGVCTILKAWKIVVDKLPSAKLLFLGGIEKNKRGIYMETVEELGLHKNVIFAGFVLDEQAVSMLNSSKIFVLPSTEEGFGLTVLEAMATGLPCILSKLDVLKENFHSAAVFVNPKDVNGWAQAVLQLLSHPEKRRKLEEKGRMLARQYSWEKVARRELEVLKSVTKR